jgi:hypothetical protein
LWVSCKPHMYLQTICPWSMHPVQMWSLKLFFFLWPYFSVNICLGPNEDRYLITGLHTVNDIYCSCCQQILGWRYVSTNML